MKKLINIVFGILFFLLLTLGMKELFLFFYAEEHYEVLREQIIKIPSVNQKELEIDDPFNRYIDFHVLEEINEEIAGWIYIPGTKVDYPIMIGDTEQEYLKKDFEGKSSTLGSIFAFPDVKLNQDFHVCLYGHNMISGQMFGGLKKYKDTEYAKSYRRAYLYTKERTKELELISAFPCENTDSILELGEKTWEHSNAEKIVNNLVKRSSITLEIPKNETAQIFTLVTCDGSTGGKYRLVLNFTLIKEKFVLE